jgi:hypothetical protein
MQPYLNHSFLAIKALHNGKNTFILSYWSAYKSNMKKILVIIICVVAFCTSSLTAFAVTPYGAEAVDENRTYTLPEMLTMAIEDEYLAYARYENVIQKFGASRPFTNILRAETMHISALNPLFDKYGIPLPENKARNHIVEPDTLTNAFKAGVEGEIANIKMYNTFLKQDIPADVTTVFTALKNASERHLTAFETGLRRLER